ncbi:S-adenosylmethionine synthetase N-terminal domain-containing protein [Anaerococcus sp. AGMB09787]|uniref:S-adenosylmethionine synthetase N-terminal domain-containing protein n=1 Tax=Anaerococcus sp. AGMB09787 TaxID=2922869 RepID=UPI001FAFB34A|nr:S-adenosylmethionine synthetase N-terminal domain-containing protein [Anaerococcus sp. AGMB09787]
MFEKVNPMHPDKIANRIAGAIVDLAYKEKENPKIAVEVLLGHGNCHVIIETDCNLNKKEIESTINRIAGDVKADIKLVEQDIHLSKNQKEKVRCGDNGIFKGVPTSDEEKRLSLIAREIYSNYSYEGKYIIDGDKLIICQSNVSNRILKSIYPQATINPLGEWTGGTDVDTGATNRKLGSDMGRAVTGGGLHGKDLSKADVSVNIYAHLKAQEENREVELSCAIGDEMIDGRPYEEIVHIARNYIDIIGGFEKFAEWGLIR